MWDPLVNDFPDTVHALRCMLAIKYCQLVANTYDPDTVGYDLIRDLILVIRARNYVEASRRYSDFNTRLQSTPPAEFRQPRDQPCRCPHCPRHKQKTGLDLTWAFTPTRNIWAFEHPVHLGLAIHGPVSPSPPSVCDEDSGGSDTADPGAVEVQPAAYFGGGS